GVQPDLEGVALGPELGDHLRGAPDRLLELDETIRQVVGLPGLYGHVPLTSASNRFVTSATIRSKISFTSASVSVRSGAWNVKLQARLRRPAPTWLPWYRSNRATRTS